MDGAVEAEGLAIAAVFVLFELLMAALFFVTVGFFVAEAALVVFFTRAVMVFPPLEDNVCRRRVARCSGHRFDFSLA